MTDFVITTKVKGINADCSIKDKFGEYWLNLEVYAGDIMINVSDVIVSQEDFDRIQKANNFVQKWLNER